MHSGWRLRSCAAVAATAAATLSFSASPAAAAGAAQQTAISLAGEFAQATIYNAAFPDGSTRIFSVELGTPGVATATPSTGPLDLAQPWAVMSETLLSDPASGHARDGDALCSTAANPTATQMAAGTAIASVDLTCDDGSGYAFYRVQWTAAPLSVVVTNPVTAVWRGGELTTWSADGMSGMVSIWPSASEVTAATVCGWVPGAAAHFDCYGQGGLNGLVVPSTNLMLSSYAPQTMS